MWEAETAPSSVASAAHFLDPDWMYAHASTINIPFWWSADRPTSKGVRLPTNDDSACDRYRMFPREKNRRGGDNLKINTIDSMGSS